MLSACVFVRWLTSCLVYDWLVLQLGDKVFCRLVDRHKLVSQLIDQIDHQILILGILLSNVHTTAIGHLIIRMHISMIMCANENVL